MRIQRQIDISRPPAEVFDYLSHAEYLPEYATDFDSVERTDGIAPGPNAMYAYKMTRGAEGTFRHTVWEPNAKLVWEGPPARSGPGTVAPGGSWELQEVAGGTRVTLTMAPVPGGLMMLLSPAIARGIRRMLPEALLRLKSRLEMSPDRRHSHLRTQP